MMRRKTPHSTMQGAPSTRPPEGSPGSTAPPGRQKGSSKASPDRRKPCGRTSRLGARASVPRQPRSACSGKQHHRPCRPSHECKPEGQTTDAIDTRPHESQSRGRYQALLYNTVRPHSRIGWLTPDAYAAQFTVQRGQGAALTTSSAPWPLATDQTEEFNRQTLAPTG
jgi:hypothetical protein